MPLLLAEVSAYDLGIFVGCLAVLLVIAAALKKLTHREPPLHREFASKEEHDALSERTQHDIEQIYNLIREQGTQLARFAQKAETTYSQLNILETKIDRILERLPR
jgi:hypothetical protein